MTEIEQLTNKMEAVNRMAFIALVQLNPEQAATNVSADVRQVISHIHELTDYNCCRLLGNTCDGDCISLPDKQVSPNKMEMTLIRWCLVWQLENLWKGKK